MSNTPAVEAQRVKRPRSGRFFLILFGVIILFSAGLGAFIFFVTGAKGSKVGESIDVLKSPSTVAFVDAKANETLYFRFDTIVIDASASAGSAQSRQRERSMQEDLRASTVSIDVALEGQPPRSVTCPAFNGTMTMSSLSSSTYTLGGVNLECSLVLTTAGHYAVRANVAWKPGSKVTEAKLEVRK